VEDQNMRRAFIGVLAVLTVSGALAACDPMHTGGGGKTDTIGVQVTGGKSTPTDFSISKGDTIKLTISTDKDEEVHLHGYDIHFDCKANVPLEKTFTADKTGQFEYELEASSTHLGNLTVNP
jgi:plastocyanin